MDTDISIKMPQSWPHNFTCFLDVCDRHTAETFYCMMRSPNSSEVASAMETWTERVMSRLTDGKVHRLHADNDLAFNGPDMHAIVGAADGGERYGPCAARPRHEPSGVHRKGCFGDRHE